MHSQFPVIQHLIHLNHAAVGPWPLRTVEAVKAFAQENLSYGSLHYLQWLEVEKKLRENLARLINAPSSDDIALVKNTSEGLSFVAYGLPWQSGDNVVGIVQEFPSNRFVWESLAPRGVEFRKLDLDLAPDPEQALFDMCDKHTRLISVSAVQYHNGLRMDLHRIGEFCRQRNILFCVDAIQHIGAMPFDVQAIGADFAVADGHKWMLSAEGLGLLYIRAELLDRLTVLQYGWHMTETLQDYSQQEFNLAETARRFECGSPNMIGIHAMYNSIALLLEHGMQVIGDRVIDNSRFLIGELKKIKGINLLSNTQDNRLSGIVTFANDVMDAQQLYKHLTAQQVLCACRGGGVRVSPHFYTPRDQLEHLIEMLKEVIDVNY